MNKETAIATYGLQATNQITPYGNLSFEQIGTWADGTPRFQAVQTLSPQEQRNQNQQWEFDNLTNQLGIDQTKRLQGHLSEPINLSNEATEARLMELGRKRLDPWFEQQRAALETKLANQGIMPGTEAYSRAITQLGEQENDAYTQLLLSGRGQAVQEALTARNQPINEITALMSGGQVTQPNFVGTPAPNVQPVDYTGLVGNIYGAQMAGYAADRQAAAARNAALMGGISGIAAAPLGGWAYGGGLSRLFGGK